MIICNSLLSEIIATGSLQSTVYSTKINFLTFSRSSQSISSQGYLVFILKSLATAVLSSHCHATDNMLA